MGGKPGHSNSNLDPEVVAAQKALDKAQADLIDIGIESGMLVASLNPVGGQIVDGISLAKNLAQGNYGGAVVDAIGFIPFGGDAIKGFFRGRKIAKNLKKANSALKAARTKLAKAKDAAFKKTPIGKYNAELKKKRDAIKNKLPKCKTKKCQAKAENKKKMDEADKELRSQSNLPAKDKGDFVDPETGLRTPAGEGTFKPKPGTKLDNQLQKHNQTRAAAGKPPLDGIPYKDGHPDLSDFPPLQKGSAGPNGKTIHTDIELDPKGNRANDKAASRAQYEQDTGKSANDLKGGDWHHRNDGKGGTGTEYVDNKVHGPLHHEGGVKANTNNNNPEF